MIRIAYLLLIAFGVCTVFSMSAVAEEAPAEEAPTEEAPAEEAPAEEAPAEAAPAEEAPPALADIRQAQIQVWISETNEQGLRDLGVNLNFYRFVRGEEQSGVLQEVRTDVFNPITQFDGVTLPVPNQDLFDAPMRPDEIGTLADGLQTRSGVGLTMSVINSNYGTLDSVFRAIERKSDVDLISKPEILVVNEGEAKIQAGGQIPYQDVTYPKGIPELTVKWRDVGVNMDIIPTILPNDFVQLNLGRLEVTDLSRFETSRGIDLPVFSTRSQAGVVQVPSGQTLVIGGLSSRVVRDTERRVPIVGKLPIIGFPFRGRQSEADITHLLVFVSPTIVDLRNLTRDAESALSFWQKHGNEWESAERIEEEIDAMRHEL